MASEEVPQAHLLELQPAQWLFLPPARWSTILWNRITRKVIGLDFIRPYVPVDY